MTDDSFPILRPPEGCPKHVSRTILDEEWAYEIHKQTLDRLAQRGGLSPVEVWINCHRLEYLARVDELAAVDFVRQNQPRQEQAMTRPSWLPEPPEGWRDSPDHRGGFKVKGPEHRSARMRILVFEEFVRAYPDKAHLAGRNGSLTAPCCDRFEFWALCAAVGLPSWIPKVPNAVGYWWYGDAPAFVTNDVHGHELAFTDHEGVLLGVGDVDAECWGGPVAPSVYKEVSRG